MVAKTVKDKNPKDKFGAIKVPIGLFPPAGVIYGALGCYDGAYKGGPEGKGYGPFNWRDEEIRLTRYLDALERHILAIRDGEDIDPKSKKPHLAHIIATGGIVADALETGNLVDDRPKKKGPAAKLLARWQGAL